MIRSGSMTKREFLKLLMAGSGCALCHGIPGTSNDGLQRFFTSVPGDDGPGKWSKRAWFCSPGNDGEVHCLKCPHECTLGPGETGICRSRTNYGGTLYSIAYGNPCAVHVDPIEKKPLYHFLPASRAFSIAVAGCNLRCLNCQNWEISQSSPRDTRNYDMMPERVVEGALSNACASIAYTYSEPTTFYEYAFDTATVAHRRKVRNVWKSCGYINELPLRQLSRVIDAANIDLKSFEEKVYNQLNGAHLEPILNTLKILKEEGVWLEITNLVIPTWTDNIDMIRRMSDWLCANGMQDSPLHFTRFAPLFKLTQLPMTPVSALEDARNAAMRAGMRYVYIGNVPGHEAENTYCAGCHKLVLERKGFTIARNDIVAGKCRWCGATIPGIWQ
jgi:pyruvate formate lyase activating enzyme